MLKCGKCDCVFDEFSCIGGIKCPECGNQHNIAPLEKCAICREYHSTCINGICKDCYESSATIETALGMGDVYSEPVELNGFLVSYFGKDRIEEILKKALVSDPKDVKDKARHYCVDDVYQLTDYLAEMEWEKDWEWKDSKWNKRKGNK